MTPQNLKSVFEAPYDRTTWTGVLQDVFGMNRVLLRPQKVDTAAVNKDWNASAVELGSFETAEGRLVGVYEVSISNKVQLARNKVGLRTLLQPVYRNDVDAALLVFNQGDCWRFSYVSELTVLNKETGARERRKTDPKRYTYLFGKGMAARTAAERFSKIGSRENLFGGGVELKAIQEAFSVESLTENFYKDLSDWYFRALKVVDFPDDAERALNQKPTEEAREKERTTRNATGTIRLITRLMFVWFLKQKRLVPDALFDKAEIDRVLNYKDKTGSTYYKAILQNLFFATLNTAMGDENRRFVDRQLGVQGFYRYRRFFKDVERFLELTKEIPFLNGGLFENLDKNVGTADTIRIDCFSNQKANEGRLTVPDSLFFETESVDLSSDYGDKKSKKTEVHGLIEILERYNFTVEESTPLEIEVALDPELLGKVFENLLASYNPETETTARKMTGSFYTPREIVDYMVDESLIEYLGNTLPDRRDDLAQLMAYTSEPHRFKKAESELLVTALHKARIVDPACGSGAFPMGVLHKMVHVLNRLDPQNEAWKALQLEQAMREMKDAFLNDSKEDRDKRLRDISDAFEKNSDDYSRKLYLIENCIYGIDIQPIAVQISKLRFFISLLTDQTIDRSRGGKGNFGVRPMPNLETKFVAANTLIGLQKPAQLLIRNPKIAELEEELKEVRHRHFSARTTRTKLKYREQDAALRAQIGELLRADGWDNATAAQVAGWNPYEHNTSADFFDAEWMFGIDDGFDVVIGNPPYVQISKLSADVKAALEQQEYKTYTRTGDIYQLFYEAGVNSLRNSGNLCYITSNKWLKALYGQTTKDWLATKQQPLKLLDLAGVSVFNSAVVDPCIMLIKRDKPNGFLNAVRAKPKMALPDSLAKWFAENSTKVDVGESANWTVHTSERQALIRKIEAQGVPLKDWNVEINRGVLTGFNAAFIIDTATRDKLVAEDPKSAEIIHKILRGEDIKAYVPNWAGKWIINSHNGIRARGIPPVNVKRDYPAVYRWLAQLSEQLQKRGDKGDHWTNLRNCAYIEEFAQPKIIYPNMTKYLPFVYDRDQFFYTNQKCFIITGETLCYLTAFLNSQIFRYCFMNRFPELGEDRRELGKAFFIDIPIKKADAHLEKTFCNLVDQIQSLKANKADSSALEAEVFEVLCNFYNLSAHEVKTIAGLS